MLKTFVASLRSDKAVKELDKIGVKVKEIGDDGVERFRNVQDVILELAVKMKYSEKDVQKTLLAVSGGKFQWSKVAAMLSSYEEIMKNWKLAIDSQGFTNTQVEKQLDTVARKFQTIKDEITGIIANGASGGISDVLKSILDKANALLHLFNNFDTATLKVTTLIAECAVFAGVLRKIGIESPFDALIPNAEKVRRKIRLATVETKGFGRAFKTLEVTAVMSLRSIKIAMTKCLPTLAVVAAAEAFGSFLELLGEYESRIGRVAEAKQLEFEANATVINNLKEQQKYTEGLITTYGALLEVQKSKKVSGKEEEELNKKIEETEKELTETIDKSAVDRIKSSDNVKEAAKKEADSARENSNAKIGALEEEQNKLLEWGRNKLKVHKAELARIVKERQAFIDGIEKKIWAVKDLWLAEKAYYAWKFNMLKYTDIELKAARAEEAMAKREYEEAEANYNPSNNADDWTPFYTLTHENPALKKYKYDAAQIKVKQLEERLEQENKEAAAIKESLADKTGLKIDDALANIEKYKWADPNSNPNYQDPENKETNPVEEKSIGKSGRGSHYRPSKEHDPVVTAINNAVKLIEKKFDKQIKSIEQDFKDKGASKALTEQNWHFHEEKINSLKEQLEKAKAHLKEQDAAIFDNEITLDSSKEIREGIISEAQSYLGVPYEYGGEDREGIDCSAFVQNVFREKGIQISRTVDAQAEDYARSGAFKDSLDGAQIGDLVFFGDNEHIGILTGKDKDGNWEMINSASHSGVSYATIAPGNYWGNWLTGVGRTSEYANMEVPFTQKLSEVLKITKDEWIKAGIEGQQALLDNAMNSEEYKDDENTLKFLNAIKTKITEPVKLVNDLQDKIKQSGISQRDAWFSNIQAEINAAKTKSDRQVGRYSRSLGLGATDADKAVFEMMKFSNELAATNEVLHREQSLSMKDTEKYLELQDKLEALIQSVQETKIKYIQAQYTENIRQMEHNSKMRWYGKDNENDLLGRQRATDTARDEMYKLRQLVARYRAIEKETPENQKALDETLELIKESAVKVQEAMTKYSKAMRDGFYKISEEFLFEAKSFKDIITGLWQDLGKDSLKVLFRQDISNPSFLGQWLGIGMPKKENLTEDAFYQFSKESALDSIDKISDALGGTGSPLLAKLKDTNFALEKSMDLSKILETDHMLALKLNTLAIQNLTTAMGMSAASGTGTGLLGGLLGGVGGTAAKTAAAAGPSLGWADLVLATGGRLDGASKSKFADGGAMASGKIVGAGTGRSDSILAYLANKDKFVWLSNGEYVINEKSAKALGYDTLDSLNKYADGGALQTSVTNPTPYIPTINPQVAQKATTIHGSNKITEALLREQNKHMMEQNEMLRNMSNSSDGGGKMVVLNTQASSADVLRALQENPRALQAILGRQKSMGFR